jgi:Lon protease-like protein
MSINKPYEGPDELPGALPIFPLPGVLLLPRGELPLNIFEPRYLAMVDDVLKTDRLIVMIQPALKAETTQEPPGLEAIGCAGRVTQFAETGDGRYMLALTGVARCRVRGELSVTTPYRQCQVDFAEFRDDFAATTREAGVDRSPILQTLKKFADANKLQIDWDEAKTAPIEILVNALSMMSPFGPGEKQALLEAPDLKTRADVLIAITEIELARRDAPRHLQ